MAKFTAIILAAGKGSRMKSEIQKQYLKISGKPLIYYSLKAFEKSMIDDIIIVVGRGDIDKVRTDIVDKYNIGKISAVVEGGTQRYHSVYKGLEAVRLTEYVLIHDGARPLVDNEIISKAMDAVRIHKACVIGMPVKDTIKIADENQLICTTPPRKSVWQIQTPQAFEFKILKKAYEQFMQNPDNDVTDDSMVVERYMDHPVKLTEGSYENIKITTPEDIILAEEMIKRRQVQGMS